MIEERFVNSGELERGVFDPFYGRYLEDRIRTKILESVSEIPKSSKIEFSMYDEENVLRHWSRLDSPEIDEESFQINVLKHIKDGSIPNGSDYRIRYNFFENKLGSPETKNNLYVQSFSDDRREIRVQPSPASSNQFRQSFFSFFGSKIEDLLKNAINFGENKYYRILNWTPIVKTNRNGVPVFDENRDPKYKKIAIIRLEQALPDSISVGSEFWIDREVSRPYFDKFEIFRKTEPTPTNELAAPDFSIDPDLSSKGKKTFESYEDIVDKKEFKTSKAFTESRFGNSSSINLNVDFTDFNEFIHFSSATERIKNFRFKIRQLDGFVDELENLNAAGRKETIRRQAESLIGSFDRYEQWLFRAENEMAYPKKTEENYPPSEVGALKPLSEAQEWFSKMLEEARRYDDRNQSALRKQIPEYIREDTDNREFVLFIDMIAHWFDLNWIYIDHFEHLTDSAENAFEEESLSQNLSRVVAESMGLETFDGFDAESFFDEIFDRNKIEELFRSAEISESDNIEIIDDRLDLSRFQSQQQIWRRLLSNLTHQYKTRGNKSSIRMLGNIFGIPTGSLVIREYGGGTSSADSNALTTTEETTHYLPFFSSQNILFPWDVTFDLSSSENFDEIFDDFEDSPKAGEIRFRTEYQGGIPIKIFELGNTLNVRAERTDLDGNFGNFVMTVRKSNGSVIEAKTEEFPIFNGEWTNILFQIRKNKPFIDLFVQQRSPVGNIGAFDQVSLKIDIGTANDYFNSQSLRFGGRLRGAQRFERGNPFIGDLDQVNIWQENISERRFNLHTLAPTRKDIDNQDLATRQSIFDLDENFFRRSLIFRSDFSLAQDLETDPIIKNESEKDGVSTETAEAFGFNSASEDPWQFERYSRKNFFSSFQVGGTTFFSTKIRTEDTTLEAPLDEKDSVEDRTSNLISKDDNRLGIFFSPYTSANRDVLSEIGIDNINQVLGDPRDQLDGDYVVLDGLNRMYWNKYERPIETQKYIRYIDEFYDAIFDHVRKSVPARASLIDGIVIEPTTLERDRERLPTGDIERDKLVAKIDAGPEEVTGEFTQIIDITASI